MIWKLIRQLLKPYDHPDRVIANPGIEHLIKHLRLTERGKELARLAQESLTGLSDFLAICQSRSTRLRLGAGESIIRWLVCPALNSIAKRIPDVSVDLRNTRTKDAVAQLSEAQLDLAIIRTDSVPEHLRCKAIGRLEYALYIPKSLSSQGASSPRGKKVPSLASLVDDIPFGRLESVGVLSRTQSEAHTSTPDLLTDSLPSLCSAIQAGYCCGVLPSLASTELPSSDFRTVFPAEVRAMTRELSLVWSGRFEAVRSHAATATKVFAEELSSRLKA